MGKNSPVTHLALSGGIGGAKLALGLEHIFNSPKLMIAGNTGDDFEHFGLKISPDLDTLLYTLSGKSDLERGWGLFVCCQCWLCGCSDPFPPLVRRVV